MNVSFEYNAATSFVGKKHFSKEPQPSLRLTLTGHLLEGIPQFILLCRIDAFITTMCSEEFKKQKIWMLEIIAVQCRVMEGMASSFLIHGDCVCGDCSSE